MNEAARNYLSWGGGGGVLIITASFCHVFLRGGTDFLYSGEHFWAIVPRLFHWFSSNEQECFAWEWMGSGSLARKDSAVLMLRLLMFIRKGEVSFS